MVKSLSNKKSDFLIFLCWAAYTFAYVARLNYNASMVEILSQLGTTKEAAGTVSSYFFFAYGVGQLVNGLLSKKYNTRYSVALALFASCIINFAMTFCQGIDAMKYLWLLNGVFQSILWSSLIKTLSDNLADSKLSKAVMVMSTTVACGTFMAYGFAALFSYLQMKWTAIFYVAALLAGAVAVLWLAGMSTLQKAEKETAKAEAKEKSKLSLTPAFVTGVAVILICAVSNGFIKDGITTWVPSILKEEFAVPSSLSIIITLLLPVLSIFGTSIVNALHKKQKDENALNGIFFFVAAILAGLIILTLNLKSVPLTLALFGAVACLMAAVNNVITSIVPLYSRDKIDSGLSAGFLNTFCYVGSTLSTSLLGKIADTRGWNDVLVCILVFTAVSFVICFVSVLLKRKRQSAGCFSEV
ncbi:MAG: MFS transporter [Clostridia bacterium]|nr:MFS transporter [Clostridia bacterium]